MRLLRLVVGTHGGRLVPVRFGGSSFLLLTVPCLCVVYCSGRDLEDGGGEEGWPGWLQMSELVPRILWMTTSIPKISVSISVSISMTGQFLGWMHVKIMHVKMLHVKMLHVNVWYYSLSGSLPSWVLSLERLEFWGSTASGVDFGVYVAWSRCRLGS